MLIAIHRHDRAREDATDVVLPAARAAEGGIAILEHQLERIGPDQVDDAQVREPRFPDRSVLALEALHGTEHVADHPERESEPRYAAGRHRNCARRTRAGRSRFGDGLVHALLGTLVIWRRCSAVSLG